LEINILKSERNFLKIIFFILMLLGAFWGLSGILEYSSRIRQLKFLLLSEPFHWNSLAASFFLLVYPFVFTSFIEEEKWRAKKILLFICLFLIIEAWLLTRFSIFWLFFLTLGGVIISFLNRKLKSPLFLKQKLGEFFVLILLLGATLPNINASFGSKIPPMQISNFQEKFIFREKKDIWRFSTEVIPRNFWWGIGAGNFEAVYRLKVIKPWTWTGFSLNEPLQTFIEQGLGSFLTQCLLFFYLFTLTFKKNLKAIKQKNLIKWEISTSVIAFLIINLFSLPAIRIFPLTIIFLIEISLFLLEERMTKIKFSYINAIMLFSLFLSLFFFLDSFLLWTGQKYFAKGKNRESEKTLNWLTKRPAYFLNPRSLIWLSACKLEKGEDRQAIILLEKAQILEPFNQDIPYEIASLFYQQGELNKALEILEREITKNPFHHPKYYYSLGMIYLEKQNNTLALHYFREGERNFPLSSQLTTPFALVFLENQKYSLYLREIYLQLYQLTQNKDWLLKFTILL
jgi:tetratricopeptide (TPR) repeat protein